MFYYPTDASIPPKVDEYVYYSRKIQNFSSDMFYCVRPRWICNIRGHKDKQFFVGNSFSIADISCFSCLEYIDLRFPKFEWKNRYKNLNKYWNIYKIRDSFKITKAKT